VQARRGSRRAGSLSNQWLRSGSRHLRAANFCIIATIMEDIEASYADVV
jgi:hypothetical protein